jgi:hypothetical protein
MRRAALMDLEQLSATERIHVDRLVERCEHALDQDLNSATVYVSIDADIPQNSIDEVVRRYCERGYKTVHNFDERVLHSDSINRLEITQH